MFKSLFGAVAIGAALVGGVVAIGYGTAEFDYRLSAHNEDVRRETLEHSRAFQEGTIRDLDNLRIDYASATGPAKEAIGDTARHRLADVDINAMPARIRSFAQDVGAGQ